MTTVPLVSPIYFSDVPNTAGSPIFPSFVTSQGAQKFSLDGRLPFVEPLFVTPRIFQPSAQKVITTRGVFSEPQDEIDPIKLTGQDEAQPAPIPQSDADQTVNQTKTWSVEWALVKEELDLFDIYMLQPKVFGLTVEQINTVVVKLLQAIANDSNNENLLSAAAVIARDLFSRGCWSDSIVVLEKIAQNSQKLQNKILFLSKLFQMMQFDVLLRNFDSVERFSEAYHQMKEGVTELKGRILDPACSLLARQLWESYLNIYQFQFSKSQTELKDLFRDASDDEKILIYFALVELELLSDFEKTIPLQFLGRALQFILTDVYNWEIFRLRLLLEQFDKAEKLIPGMFRIHRSDSLAFQDSLDHRLWRALLFFRKKNFARALVLCNEVLEGHPMDDRAKRIKEASEKNLA